MVGCSRSPNTCLHKNLITCSRFGSTSNGITQRIFIFSWDRSEEHQIAAINPIFTPLNQEKELGWKGCFSIILGNGPYQLANVPRYKKIKASYWDANGQLRNVILEGFAARVFQHEYDHLEGIENIHRKDAEIKTFESREKLMAFMNEIKAKDKVNYIQPIDLKITPNRRS